MSTAIAEARAIEQALLDERLENARKTHVVRLAGVGFAAALFLGLGLALGDARWQASPWPVTVWLFVSLGLWGAQRAGPRVAAWLTLAPAVVDVPLIYVVQRAQYDSTPSPSGVAGFTMGLFALVLGIAALSMSRWQLWATAASASLFEVLLQAQADVSVGAQATAVVVLALTAQVLAYSVERRAHLLRQMARSQKLAAVGQLAAAVGHDLRNPLAAISNSVFVLRRRLDKAGALTPAVLEPLALAERETEATRRIVTDLLDFTREAPLEREAVPLQPLLDEVAGLVRRRDAVRLSLDVAGLGVSGSRDRLRQVLMNLVQNAAEAVPEGRAGHVEVRAAREGAQVRVTVRDDGEGMDEATRARVLEPLFTTKKEGTGLGLAIVDSLVKQHGGTLRLDSTPGQGTTVTVRLPAADVQETFKPAGK